MNVGNTVSDSLIPTTVVGKAIGKRNCLAHVHGLPDVIRVYIRENIDPGNVVPRSACGVDVKRPIHPSSVLLVSHRPNAVRSEEVEAVEAVVAVVAVVVVAAVPSVVVAFDFLFSQDRPTA